LEWWKGWLLRSGAFPLTECPRPLNWMVDYRNLGALRGWSGRSGGRAGS